MPHRDWDDDLLKAYIEYGRRFGGGKPSTRADREPYNAVCEITDSDDPEHVLKFVLALLEVTPDDQLDWVAAGPLENLLWKHGAAVIDRVLTHAERNGTTRRALGGVWGEMDPSVGDKIAKARQRWRT
jgi:hypothetical protein